VQGFIEWLEHVVHRRREEWLETQCPSSDDRLIIDEGKFHYRASCRASYGELLFHQRYGDAHEPETLRAYGSPGKFVPFRAHPGSPGGRALSLGHHETLKIFI